MPSGIVSAVISSLFRYNFAPLCNGFAVLSEKVILHQSDIDVMKTSFMFPQAANAPVPMVVTELPMETEVNAVHK